jgi:restriction endonuclease S subunit
MTSDEESRSVPKGWSTASLGEIEARGLVKLGRGKIISRRDIASNPGDYPIYSSAGQNGGEFGRYGSFLFDEELITWSVDGGGHLFYRPKHRFSVTNVGGWLRILDFKFFSYKYLYFALTYLHSNITFDWSRKAHPSVIRLAYDAIPIPPLGEQEKIVEILEEQFSRLDAALDSVRAVREKSARFRRSLLHTAFTGGLNGLDTSDGTLPVGWKRGTIAQVAEVVAGRTPTKFEQRLAGSTVENRNVPFYKVGDMNSAAQYLREARVYFAEDESGSFGIEILPAGTVIFPKAGGAIATNKKRVLEVPGAIDLNCMGVGSNGVLLPQLLYWFFESFNLSSIADGSVLPQIGKKKVSSIEICYPESEFEQRKLLEDIEASVSRSDAVDGMLEAIEQKAAAFRRSLLHAAFSGDLTKEWREGAHV